MHRTAPGGYRKSPANRKRRAQDGPIEAPLIQFEQALGRIEVHEELGSEVE